MEKVSRENFSKAQILRMIFFTTLTVSATGSSGYAILAGLKKTFVDKYGWMEEDEMMNCTSLAQSAPGPMAISGSVVVGYNLAGVSGATAAVLGTTLPPLVIMIFVCYFYEFIAENKSVQIFLMAMRASVSALILSIAYDSCKNIIKKKKALYIIMAVVSFILMKVMKLSTLTLIVMCAIIGVGEVLFNKKGGKTNA